MKKGFDVWSYGPSLVRAGDFWVDAERWNKAEKCYETFLLRCGQKTEFSRSVRSKLSDVKNKKSKDEKGNDDKEKYSRDIDDYDIYILISVIMTTYNSEKYVKKSIESILSQSHYNFELIIVDDASEDKTFEILEEYSKKDSRIKIIKNKVNRGTYWSKNIGLSYAKGDFVTTQDSDDTSDNDRLKLQLKEFTKNPKIRVSSCNYVRVDSNGNIVMNIGLEER